MLILTSNNKDIDIASKLLLDGKLVAFPTETVYGVGCIFDNVNAYNNLNKLKRRSPDKPYTLMLGNVDDINKYVDISNKTFNFIKKYLPGSVTFLLPVKHGLADYLSKDNIIGIRVPSNIEALSLLKQVNKPLLVPSLNRSGYPPINNKNEIIKEFNDDLDALIVGEIKDNVPSTIIYINDKIIKVIREGKLPSINIIKEYNKL